jgi:hypothetical protein
MMGRRRSAQGARELGSRKPNIRRQLVSGQSRGDFLQKSTVAVGHIGACRLDVGHDEVEALRRSRRRFRDSGSVTGMTATSNFMSAFDTTAKWAADSSCVKALLMAGGR